MSIYANMAQWMSGSGQSINCTTASATVSAAFPAATTSIRVVATTDTWIEIALGASASASSAGFLPANLVEYLPANGAIAISALSASLNGTLYIKPCCG